MVRTVSVKIDSGDFSSWLIKQEGEFKRERNTYETSSVFINAWKVFNQRVLLPSVYGDLAGGVKIIGDLAAICRLRTILNNQPF
jgi:hypothetical protein